MSTTGKSVVTLPSETEVTVAREFDAAPDLVFRAHSEPALLSRWLATPGYKMTVKEHAFEVGGKYLHTWTSEQDGSSFSFAGEFQEIVPNAKIVQVERFVGAPGHCLCTTTFEDLGGKTRLVTNMNYDSQATRDMAVSTGMTDGMEVCYAQLEAIATSGAI